MEGEFQNFFKDLWASYTRPTAGHAVWPFYSDNPLTGVECLSDWLVPNLSGFLHWEREYICMHHKKQTRYLSCFWSYNLSNPVWRSPWHTFFLCTFAMVLFIIIRSLEHNDLHIHVFRVALFYYCPVLLSIHRCKKGDYHLLLACCCIYWYSFITALTGALMFKCIFSTNY